MTNKNIVEDLFDETQRDDYPQERENEIRANIMCCTEIFRSTDEMDDMRRKPCEHYDNKTTYPENYL